MTIRSPMEWGWDMVRRSAVVEAPVFGQDRILTDADLTVHRIGTADLVDALRKGFDDFGATRTDVIFLCVIYPVIGLLLGRFAFGAGILPLLFPLAAGFALIGPLAAVGLNEMSRKRELEGTALFRHAFTVFRSPAIGAILLLGMVLLGIFILWMMAAATIYELTLGPAWPESAVTFAHDVLATGAGWTMIVAGMGVGFLFAVLVLAITVISFPLLLDHRVSAATAMRTSLRVFNTNRRTMAVWGLIIAAGLLAGSIPLFIGLTIVMPVLGHATWHLYRRAVST